MCRNSVDLARDPVKRCYIGVALILGGSVKIGSLSKKRIGVITFINETLAQCQVILNTGLKIEFINFAETGDPYGNPRNAIIDVVQNNRLWMFPSNPGSGSS